LVARQTAGVAVDGLDRETHALHATIPALSFDDPFDEVEL
jgi:hypothetical protein